MSKLLTIIIVLLSINNFNCYSSIKYSERDFLLQARSSFVIVEPRLDDGRRGIGSGVIVRHHRETSVILTAGHVCDKKGVTFKVYDFKGFDYDAVILGFVHELKSPKRDICTLVTLKRIPRRSIRISKYPPQWGDFVWNLNASLGDFYPFQDKKSPGFIQIYKGYYSGYSLKTEKYVFTGLGVLRGASGSMVLNSNGELISIITSYRYDQIAKVVNEMSFGSLLKDIKILLAR